MATNHFKTPSANAERDRFTFMKTAAFIFLFVCFSAPVYADLTDADLDKIRLIVKDEIRSEITASEARMKAYVDTKVDSLKTPITWLIGILVAIIAIIGLPLAILTIFLGWRSVRDTSLQQQIDTFAKAIETQNKLETTIEQLTREIETLKRQQV